MLVLDENNELNDMALYALGLKSEEEIGDIMDAALNGTELKQSDDKWTYEDICGMDFRVVLNASCYSLDDTTGTYTDLRDSDAGLRYLYDNAIPLKVSGIIRPNEDALSTMLSGAIGYTSELTEYVIAQTEDSAAIHAQLDDPTTDIFTGLPFNESSGSISAEEKEADFRAYVEPMSDAEKAQTYVKIMSIPSQEQMDAAVAQATSGANPST